MKANHVTAASWYRKAADHGHGAAAVNLGFCYALGQGVEKDLTAASKLFNTAAGLVRRPVRSRHRAATAPSPRLAAARLRMASFAANVIPKL